MISRNSAAVEKLPWVTIWALNSDPGAIGWAPSAPVAVWLFCSCTALNTSAAARPKPANLSRSSQMRMACEEPNSRTSPTPVTRRNSLTMLFDAKLPMSVTLFVPSLDCRAIVIRKPEAALKTRTPTWRTGCGRRGSTRLMRSCTCMLAISRSVPGLKVTVITAVPLARLVADM